MGNSNRRSVEKPVVIEEQQPEKPNLIDAAIFKQHTDETTQKKLHDYTNFVHTEFRDNIRQSVEGLLGNLVGKNPPFTVKVTDMQPTDDYQLPISDELDSKLKRSIIDEFFAANNWKILDVKLINAEESGKKYGKKKYEYDTFEIKIDYSDNIDA